MPKATPPVGSYVATKVVGKLLYISGQISNDENGKLIQGKLGKDLNNNFFFIFFLFFFLFFTFIVFFSFLN